MGIPQAKKPESLLRAALILFSMTAGVAAQTPNAPPRPHCTALTGPGSCDWKATNGVGPGVRIVLSDQTGSHDQSKAFLRAALDRLSQKYGFTVTRISGVNDITDSNLQNAKVIIFSSGDGTVGGSIPNDTVKQRVENFVKVRGWGMLMIHEACGFISNWPFQQQACVQQYNHHNTSGTPGTVYVENRVVDSVGQGRANPYSSFFLAGLPDSVRMSDEWFTWAAAPRTTTEVAGAPIVNLNMLLRLNEASVTGIATPTFGIDHDLVWTSTQGNGISIFNSMGHDDTYQQDGTRRAYGDSLLWRELRYAAKDWDTVSAVSLAASRQRSNLRISGQAGALSLSFGTASAVSVSLVDIAGRLVYSQAFAGGKPAEIAGLKRGVYWVRIASGRELESRKVAVY